VCIRWYIRRPCVHERTESGAQRTRLSTGAHARDI